MEFKMAVSLLYAVIFIVSYAPTSTSASFGIDPIVPTVPGTDMALELAVPISGSGTNPSCIYDWGDGEGASFHEFDNPSSGTYTRSYEKGGYFEVFVTCMNEDDIDEQNFTVYVGDSITEMSANRGSSILILNAAYPLDEDFPLPVSFATGTDVNVTAEIVASGFTASVTGLQANGTTYEIALPKEQFDVIGMYAVVVNATNPLTDSVNVSVVIAVLTRVNVTSVAFSSASYSSEPYYVMTNEPFSIDTVFEGTDVVLTWEIVYENAGTNETYAIEGFFCEGSVDKQTFTYTFNITGTFYLMMQASNYINYYNHPVKRLISIYKINGFDVQMANTVTLIASEVTVSIDVESNALHPMDMVTCNIQFGNGHSHNITFDYTTSLTSLAESYAYTFPEIGHFNALVTCYNNLPAVMNIGTSSRQIFPFYMIVENAVENLVLKHDSINASYHPYSHTVVFTVELDPAASPALPNMTCTFEFTNADENDPAVTETGDIISSTEKITTEKKFIQGNIEYIINVNCSNQVDFHFMTVRFFVYFDCWIKNYFDQANRDPSNPRESLTNKLYWLRGDVKFANVSECIGPVVIRWRIFEYNNNNEIDPSPFPLPQAAELSIPPFAFEANLYKIELTTTFSGMITPASLTDFTLIQFKLPRLVPSISDGSIANQKRYVIVNDTITIDSSASSDPARDTTKPQPWLTSDSITRAWTCEMGVAQDSDIALHFAVGGALSGFSPCPQNALPADPGDDAFDLPPRTMEAEKWYIYKLTYSRGNRIENVSQAIFARSKPSLPLEFEYQRNGRQSGGPSHKLRMIDLELNIAIRNVRNESAVYRWEFQYLDTTDNTFKDITDQIQGSTTDTGVKVPKETFINMPQGTIFQIKCTVELRGNDEYAITTLSQQYITNHAPYNGNCTISKQEAVAAKDIICVKCEDWKDEADNPQRNPAEDTGGLLFYSVVQRFTIGDGYEINSTFLDAPISGSNNLEQCFKIRVPPDNNNYTMVEVKIEDPLGSPSARQQFLVKVNPPITADITGSEGSSEVNQLYADSYTSVEEAMNIGDFTTVIVNVAAIASCFSMGGQIYQFNIEQEVKIVAAGISDIRADGSVVDVEEAFEDTKKAPLDETAIAIRGVKAKLASTLSVAFENYTEEKKTDPKAMIAVLSSVATIYSGDENGIDKNVLELSASIMTKVLERLGEISELNGDSTEFLDYLQEGMVTMGKLSEAISPNDEKNMKKIHSEQDARKLQENLFEFGTPQEQEAKDKAKISDAERVFFMYKRQLIVQLNSAEHSQLGKEQSSRIDMFLSRLTTFAPPSDGSVSRIGDVADSPAITTMTRLVAEKAKDTVLEGKEVAVKLPELDATGKVGFAIYEGSKTVNTDPDGKFALITSKEVHMELQFTGQDITGLIQMEFKVAPAIFKLVQTTVFSEDADLLHREKVWVNSVNEMLCIVIRPTSARVQSYKVWLSTEETVSKLVFQVEETLAEYNSWTNCFLPTQMKMKRAGFCRYGIETFFKETVATETRRKRSATNVTSTGFPPMNTSVATMNCMVLDENKDWRTDQCSGRWLPDEGKLICECLPQKKMTFANSFYVPPNTIDFGSVFLKFSPLNQAAVMGTLGGILLIYIVVVIWARGKDRKDLLRWGITPLADNFAEDNYFYVVRIYTGVRPGAGTKSKVGFVIAGEEMDTGVRELSDGVRKEFSTGSVMNFLMSTTVYLGDLEYVRVWHDNSGAGNSASWYLSKVEIQDVQRSETFTFLVERWLAVEKEDGLLECVVPVCKVENLNIFRNRFYMNAKENLAESHIWISVVYRPQTSHFTRVQRATCAFVFLMLTMISNAMFFRGEENYETPAAVQVGPFRFTLQQIYISLICALITTPATLVIIYLFKLSRPNPPIDKTLFGKSKRARRYRIPVMESWLEKQQRKSTELEQSLVTKGYPNIQGFSLPHAGIKLAWFLCVITVLLSAFFIMLYSMEWGKQKSEEWLTTFFLSFFESVFCLDPIKIAVMAVVFAILVRSASDSASIVDRSTIMRRYKSNLRGKSGGIRLPSPPLDTNKLESARAKREVELKMKTAVKDMCINIFMIWILFSISFGTRDIWSYNMHQEIVDAMLSPPGDQQSFYEIKTINEYFDWLNNTAINNLFPEEDITGQRLHWRLRQFLQDGAKFRVGPPRLRQLRTTKETCKVPHYGEEDCYKKYSEPMEETGSYCIGWNSTPCDPEEKVYKYSSDAWKFTSAFDIWGFPITGYYTTYGGGGYITKLSVNREVSHLIVREVYDNSWVDRQTRAVLFEFTLYCLNANIFTYNIFMAEFPETGGVFPYVMILPLRVYMHIGALGIYILACEIIFLIYLAIISIMTGIQLYQQKKAFFKKPWQVYDFIFIILSYISMIMYFVRYAMTTKSLSVFKEDPKAFVNFFHIALWDQVFVLLVGVLVFMAVLRLLNTFGYNKRISAVAKVFTNAASELIWFGIFFLNIFTCYAVFGYLLFGANLRSYRNVYATMGTLFISMIGKSRFTEIEQTDPIFSKIYFMIFIFFVVYMILTMFLAVLSKSIDKVHQDVKTNKGDEMVDYVINKFKGFLSFNKKKPGNATQHKPAAPWNMKSKTRWNEVDNRAILEDIRMSLNEAIMFDPEEMKFRVTNSLDPDETPHYAAYRQIQNVCKDKTKEKAQVRFKK